MKKKFAEKTKRRLSLLVTFRFSLSLCAFLSPSLTLSSTDAKNAKIKNSRALSLSLSFHLFFSLHHSPSLFSPHSPSPPHLQVQDRLSFSISAMCSSTILSSASTELSFSASAA